MNKATEHLITNLRNKQMRYEQQHLDDVPETDENGIPILEDHLDDFEEGWKAAEYSFGQWLENALEIYWYMEEREEH